MIKKQSLKKRNICKLTFELPADLNADTVELLADFNGWQPVPFDKLKSGKWKLQQEVEPGQAYQFRYRVLQGDQANYVNDAMADTKVPNDHGSENAVIHC